MKCAVIFNFDFSENSKQTPNRFQTSMKKTNSICSIVNVTFFLMALSLMLNVPRRHQHYKTKLYLLKTHAEAFLAHCTILLHFFSWSDSEDNY